jgi:GDP-L-fucose synthase
MKLEGKKIWLSGGSGMLGSKLVELLLAKGAKVTVVSLDSPDRLKNKDVNFIQADLRFLQNCLDTVKGHDIVIAAAGTKGSPKLTKEMPLNFMTPMLMFNTNTLEAARLNNVEWTVYLSSVGVYGQDEVFVEDKMWDKNPSLYDWEAGWTKRMGEMQLEAYAKQYKKRNFSIVRPVNIHGPFDNFSNTGMVIPSLIRRALESKDKLKVFGDGTPIRDFISSHDVARAVIFCIENEISLPCNIGSGTGISIKQLVETILKYIPHQLEIEWDDSFPSGDKYRVASMERLFSYGFKLEKSLDESIKETIEWYINNKGDGMARYDVFRNI